MSSKNGKGLTFRVISIVLIVVVVAGGLTVYLHHRSEVKHQQQVQAQMLQQEEERTAQANVKKCESSADMPYEAVLMYDISIDPNAAEQMQQANEHCQQEYGQ